MLKNKREFINRVIKLAEEKGTLSEDGYTIVVKVPSGRIYIQSAWLFNSMRPLRPGVIKIKTPRADHLFQHLKNNRRDETLNKIEQGLEMIKNDVYSRT